MQGIEASFLEGQLLIAMPGMGDPRFEKSVVFVCSHSDQGAMGLIVNKPAPDLRFDTLLEQLDITSTIDLRNTPVHFGGPVEHGRGFVLHTPDYAVDGGSIQVNTGFSMTATLDILRDMAVGRGPDLSLLALGYSGWGPGQLESEIRQNAWLTASADQELVFGGNSAGKWDAALRSLDIDPRLLSGGGGSA
ncbi:YqgE/AlgH family protein [Amaricoccus tamworthensis]|uniref:YqgE/AlgH family protein n=1 Tax=Amaricoccus tamworthensis TaxID=57002 RepID=UPI003C7D7DDD